VEESRCKRALSVFPWARISSRLMSDNIILAALLRLSIGKMK
jgi:hypothetical protein